MKKCRCKGRSRRQYNEFTLQQLSLILRHFISQVKLFDRLLLLLLLFDDKTRKTETATRARTTLSRRE